MTKWINRQWAETRTWAQIALIVLLAYLTLVATDVAIVNFMG